MLEAHVTQETEHLLAKYHFSFAAFLAGFNSCFVK